MVAKPLCPLYKNIIKPLDRARYPELRYAMYVRVGFSHDVASLLTKLTTYKSGITEVTGVKMLNNTMTVTDKFSNAYTKETDETSPRAKGMRNYKERIKKISKQKRGQMFKKQLEI